ncbi:hypothetical protein K474DRAFT_1673028 [Panus rudis PR-1116 ss-1]|nr:hypothetical protein K474DRAFT_1673028 [Panus rudis PR-1116 ss-1]
MAQPDISLYVVVQLHHGRCAAAASSTTGAVSRGARATSRVTTSDADAAGDWDWPVTRGEYDAASEARITEFSKIMGTSFGSKLHARENSIKPVIGLKPSPACPFPLFPSTYSLPLLSTIMSSSPNRDDDPKDELPDESPAADQAAGSSAQPAADPVTPGKRGRGRPKGSKNKKTLAKADEPPQPKRPRGRPRKRPLSPEGGEPKPKRPRGRPRKNPAPPAPEAAQEPTTDEGGEAEAGPSSEPPKRKRGRPRKS